MILFGSVTPLDVIGSGGECDSKDGIGGKDMITRTLLLSLLLAGAGCAHRTYVGASYSEPVYSGTTYSSADSDYYYEPATSKGAGARALKNETEVYSEPTLYSITTADPAAANTQGAGARALIGQPDTVVMAEPGVEVTTYRS